VRPGDPVAAERQADPQTSTLNLAAALQGIEGDHVDDSTERDAVAAVEALPPGSALLVVKRGPNAGSRFLLDSELTTAGRHPDSDIFLDDVTVSRRHAEFHRSPYSTSFTVRDVGSLNGTYLNRERIDSAELSSGDEVQIGKFRLVFLTSSLEPAGGGGPL
jgi:pSer/pThr/pTyr-binding forkhead associated (FHA) protein